MYGQNYAQAIEGRIASTTATPQSIEYLGEEVVHAIKELDDQIVSVLQQRRHIVARMEPFFTLYQSVSGERLLDALPALSQLDDDPTDLNARDLVQKVTDIADEMWDERVNAEDFVALGQLENKLKEYAREENVKIPWSNPRAVISTILMRSGNWERETARQYKRIDSPPGWQ